MVPYLWQNSVVSYASYNAHINFTGIWCIFKCRNQTQSYSWQQFSNTSGWVHLLWLPDAVYHSASLKEQGEKSDNKGAWVKKRIERSLRKYSPVKNKLQRIMDCFGLERILKVIWFQHLCHEQEHLVFCHVAQKQQCSSLALNTGWGTHGFSGQPVSVLDHLTLKNFFLIF